MPSPVLRQDEATAAAAEQDMCYCLVPVSIDRQTWQTPHLSLPDGASIPIPRRLEQEDLLSYEEAEQIRPGIARRMKSCLAPFLTFRREDRALVAPIVSPDSAGGVGPHVRVGGTKGRHSTRSHQNLVSAKRSLFNNAPVASKVLEVETLGAPPIDLCDSDDEEESISEKRNTRSRKFSNTKKRSRRSLKEPGSRSSRKRKARKTRYTLSAPGFTSEEDDGHESDSTFQGETDGGDEKSEEEGSCRVLRPKSIRRARLNYDEGGGDDDDRNSDDDNGDLLTNDNDESSVPVDVQLFCSLCGEHHNKDDFSLQQQANLNDQYRFCLLHHGVGHQTIYEGTSSVRKLASQLDEIGEKYKDVGSDDEVIGDSDFSSSDADEYLEENNNNVTNSGNKRKCSPKRIKRMAEGLLGEESDSDEDAFASDEHLHTQPPCVFDDDDDDDDDENEELHGEKDAGQAKRRRCITDDE